jgi:hypothetical protein
MAILIRPELTNAPYRTLAEQADVALGTLAGCMSDLAARGLLLDGKGGRKVADRRALVALCRPTSRDFVPSSKSYGFKSAPMPSRRFGDVWARF